MLEIGRQDSVEGLILGVGNGFQDILPVCTVVEKASGLSARSQLEKGAKLASDKITHEVLAPNRFKILAIKRRKILTNLKVADLKARSNLHENCRRKIYKLAFPIPPKVMVHQIPSLLHSDVACRLKLVREPHLKIACLQSMLASLGQGIDALLDAYHHVQHHASVLVRHEHDIVASKLALKL